MHVRRLLHRTGTLPLGQRTFVMGIVNVTPDSFSDGGVHAQPEDAVAGARRMAVEGVDILDIGGESTRPGHVAVAADEEWARVAPVLDGLAQSDDALPPVSIDTWKAMVARRAVAAGASIVNDVWGFQRDPDIAHVAAETGAAAILMHNREQADATIDIVEDILRFLDRSVRIAVAAGVAEDRIVLDPGIDIAKTPAESVELLRRLPELARLGRPLLLAVSRKDFVGALTERQPADRDPGTLAAVAAAVEGGARIIRVHDVAGAHDYLRVHHALANGTTGGLELAPELRREAS
jgi:dihydropteroate synthase